MGAEPINSGLLGMDGAGLLGVGSVPPPALPAGVVRVRVLPHPHTNELQYLAAAVDELRGLRSDLAGLRQELQQLRPQVEARQPATPEPVPEGAEQLRETFTVKADGEVLAQAVRTKNRRRQRRA